MRKLKNHKSAQSSIFENDKEIILYSYTTKVIIINKVKNTLDVTGLYSNTTRRHISWFMDELFGDRWNYYDVKNAYENNTTIWLGGKR